MRTILALLTAALLAMPARAQIFGPGAASGALWGGVAGAIIGHNSGDLHHNGWKGAAIGAGAGMLLGSIYDSGHNDGYYGDRPAYPRAYVSYGYRGYYARPSYGYRYAYGYGPSYASTGFVLGGITGAIIGYNHHGRFGHDYGWRGAAIGAGAGLLLGSIIDSYARPDTVVVDSPTVVETVPTVAASTPVQAAPQNVTVINNYYGTSPMASANSLYGR